ncbi:MAG: serine O-acetyltransferase [Planctomycetota bacterium]
MKFRDCFTIDLYARTNRRHSFRELCKKLIFDVGYRVVVYYRIAMFFKKVRFPNRLTNLLSSLFILRLCRVPGVEIRTKFEIGAGLSIYHPHDIVIGAGCKIGKNVALYSGITIGARILISIDENNDPDTRYPTIEDGVTIFSGAKVIGAITIGQNSIIGANSVVNKSFPANSIIAGIPARLINKRQ